MPNDRLISLESLSGGAVLEQFEYELQKLLSNIADPITYHLMNTTTPKAIPTVSIELEIPAALYDSLVEFIESHPNYSQNRAGTEALALFLLQSGVRTDRTAARIYLDSLFGKQEAA